MPVVQRWTANTSGRRVGRSTQSTDPFTEYGRFRMTTSKNDYFIADAEAHPFEPFLVAGEPCGEVSWIRTEGSNGSTLATGLWRSHAQTFDYPFLSDETIHVLEGTLDVDFENGERLTLRAGDIASFTKGSASTWTVTEGFKKLFVVSG